MVYTIVGWSSEPILIKFGPAKPDTDADFAKNLPRPLNSENSWKKKK